MPRVLIFLDLDDTILQTAAKCPPSEPVVPAAVDRIGQVLSFMTRTQQHLLAFWLERGTVIPVTGRTDEALTRVMLNFDSWRITHHGAVIRQPDGCLPAWWYTEIRPLLVAAQPRLWEYVMRLEQHAVVEGYRVRSHSVDEWLTYVSIKADADAAVLDAVHARLEAEGLPEELALHHNGNNMAIMIRGAQKHDAVRRVMAELGREGPIISIGAGDSLSDIPFLRICDFALVPRNSQIQTESWREYAQ